MPSTLDAYASMMPSAVFIAAPTSALPPATSLASLPSQYPASAGSNMSPSQCSTTGCFAWLSTRS